jgi:hypothetical protein
VERAWVTLGRSGTPCHAMPWRNDGSSGRNTPRQRGVLHGFTASPATANSLLSCRGCCSSTSWHGTLGIRIWRCKERTNGISRDIENIAKRGDSSKKINQKVFFFCSSSLFGSYHHFQYSCPNGEGGVRRRADWTRIAVQYLRYSHRLNPSQRQPLACTMPHQVVYGGR